MLSKKSHRRFQILTGTLLVALAASSGAALADDKDNHRAMQGKGHAFGHDQGKGKGNGKAQGGGGSKPVAAPEIDVGAGGNALALLAGGVLLAGERARLFRKR